VTAQHTSPPEGDWLVSRSLRVDVPLDQAGADRLTERLTGLPGVVSLAVQSGSRRIKVRYDLTRCQYSALAQALSALGHKVDSGPWRRLRAALYRIQDENGRANASSPAGPCCNRPPTRGR
jgi:hypothetical protein